MGRRSRSGLALLLGLAAALAVAAPAPAATPIRCNGEQYLCLRTFDRVVLPGAHNAMSAQSLGWSIPNQQVGVREQLAMGIKAFLLDTYYGHVAPDGSVVADATPTPQSRLYLCHVLCRLGATPLIDVLRTMRIYLENYPGNVLAIINEDSVRPEDFAREVRLSGLLRHVYRGPPGPWPTLRAMVRGQKQVVVMAERDSGSVPWYHEAYSGILQETPYTWPTLDLLTKPANWTASCRPNRGGTIGSLFLMNHWSPPVAPDPQVSAVVNATSVLTGRAQACRALRGRLPSIVAVDMAASGGLIEAVRRLNAAG